MGKIKLVIFDWAGTTVDFGSVSPVNAMYEAFKEYQIELSHRQIRQYMGMLKYDHIKALFNEAEVAQNWEAIHGRPWQEEDVQAVYQLTEDSLMASLKDYSQVKPYVLETIEKLRKKGIKIGSTTGYTDEMMEIVTQEAAKQGYRPDFWITPNSVNNMGRPYPYMVFENIKALEIDSIHSVIKVGDTLSDIQEGLNAGIKSIGIIDGSSLMGLNQEEYANLSDQELSSLRQEIYEQYIEAGATAAINDIRDLISLLEEV